ncbi:ParB/RepB/Spo0J family partition protein [Streptomyces sp. NPDC002055]|uniref:ParB/RepB/Spo0J family partition protein n=1 Tax=Streptomyces sp. NPDC002055 TaxID=3154534 RepID=UPI00332E9082
MSKANQLGNSSAFGMANTPRSSRRGTIDSAINGDNASAAAITDLPVTLISDNPDNPRNHLRSLEETVESVREVGIILPIVVATVEAYLHERPTRADDLDDGAQYIVVDGHRRLEAARRVGLATIPVRVDNDRVSSDERLLEAAFVANYHRDDMTDLEEAQALKSLVDYYKSQTKASKRLGIPQGTISTKLSLLKLSPELQKDLVTGERTVEHVRNLGKLSAHEQKAKADERAEAARRKAEKAKRQEQAAGQTAKTEASAADVPTQVSRRDNPGADADDSSKGVSVSAPAPSPEEPRSELAQPGPQSPTPDARDEEQLPDGVLVKWLPLDNPSAIMRILRARMTPADFEQLARDMHASLQSV